MKHLIINLHFVLTVFISILLVLFLTTFGLGSFVGTIVIVGFLGNKLFEFMNPGTLSEDVRAGFYGSVVVVLLFYVIYALAALFCPEYASF